MKLARLGDVGQEVPVLITDQATFDLRPVVGDLGGEQLAPASLQAIADAAASGSLPELAGAADLRVGSPIARPSSILCIGQNYAEHAAEYWAVTTESPMMFFTACN